jgi:hypothetical protein
MVKSKLYDEPDDLIAVQSAHNPHAKNAQVAIEEIFLFSATTRASIRSHDNVRAR